MGFVSSVQKYVNGIIDMCKMSSSKECLQFFTTIINLIEFNLNSKDFYNSVKRF